MEYDLVFEGGGAKGLAFAGALRAFERRGHTVRRVIGTSAGSIVASIIAAGYDAAESQAAIAERLPNLLKSLSLYFKPGRSYTEVEVNGLIEEWRTEVGQSLQIDHVTLRRALVDEAYLRRSSAGESYQLEDSVDKQFSFAADVDAIDPQLVVLEAAEEISKRRARYEKKSA